MVAHFVCGLLGRQQGLRLRHSWVTEAALVDHNAPAWFVAAVLRETVGQKCWPQVAGVTADRAALVLKGDRQGAPGG